jgi:hypothetical protein
MHCGTAKWLNTGALASAPMSGRANVREGRCCQRKAAGAAAGSLARASPAVKEKGRGVRTLLVARQPRKFEFRIQCLPEG